MRALMPLLILALAACRDEAATTTAEEAPDATAETQAEVAADAALANQAAIAEAADAAVGGTVNASDVSAANLQ